MIDRYAIKYMIDDTPHTAYYHRMPDMTTGFWINEKHKLTNGEDSKWFIPASRVLYIGKQEQFFKDTFYIIISNQKTIMDEVFVAMEGLGLDISYASSERFSTHVKINAFGGVEYTRLPMWHCESDTDTYPQEKLKKAFKKEKYKGEDEWKIF